MKPRRWILALLLVAGLLGLGAAAAWIGLDLGGRLRDDLVRRLSEAGLEDAAIDAVHPAWIGLDLDSLRFRAGDGRLEVEIALTRLRLSPLRWLKKLGEPLAALDLVELRDPELVWRRVRSGGGDVPPAWRPSGKAWRALQGQLGLLPEIRLRDGRIRAALDPDAEPRVLVDRLQGLVLLLGGRVELILRSRVLDGDHRGFEADLQLDTETMDGGFQLALDSLRVGSDLFPELAGRAEGEMLSSFRLDGRLAGGRLDSLAGGGRIRIDSLSVARLNAPLALELDLVAGLDGLTLRTGRLDWRGQRVDLQGWSDFGLRRPRLEARVKGLDLAELADGLGLDGGPAGRLELQADVGLDSLRWRVEGRMAGQELAWKGQPLGRFDAEFSGDVDLLRIDRWAWEPPGWARVGGEGRWRPAGEGAGLSLSAASHLDAAGLPGIGAHLKSGLGLDLELEVDWPKAARGTGWGVPLADLQGRLGEGGEVALTLSGQASLDRFEAGRWPQVDLLLEDRDGLVFGNLAVQQGTDGLWSLQLPQAGRLAEVLLKNAAWLPDGRIELDLDGRAGAVAAVATLERPGLDARLDGALLVAGDSVSLGADLLLAGRRGAELRGEVQLQLLPESIELQRLELAGQLSAKGRVDFAARSYRLDLTADDLALQPFWDLASEDPAPIDPGSLSLDLAGEGPLDQPGLRGGVEFRLRTGSRQLRLRGDLEFDREQVALGRGLLSVDGRDFADLELDGRLDGHSGLGRLAVRESDLGVWLPDLVAGGQPLLGGRTAGGGELVWNEADGVRGDFVLRVDEPRLAGRVFDRFDLRLSHGRDAAGRIALDSLVLSRGGPRPLRLEAQGWLPLGAADEFDLDLSLVGDLLQPLSVTTSGEASRFFRVAEGTGSLELSLGGTRVDPQLQGGRLRIPDGCLELESVFRSVRNIDVDLEIENGQVDFQRFEARLGKDRLRLRNLRPEELPVDLDLEAWTFDFGELDFGVISIETLDRRGRPGPVDVNIPGLMARDWDARVELGGLGDDLPCLLAGPLERPRLRGLARVSNTRFTYPFLEGETEPTPLLQATIDFLNSIEWDLAVLPGRNVNYYRKVQGFEDSAVFDRLQGYLDRITVDLWIDPSTDPLLFTGQIEEESFRVLGEVGSRRGSVLYLDKDFEVEDAGMVFDASSLLPVVWGRAVHYSVDGAGESDNPLFTRSGRAIYIQLVTRDELGNQQLRGRWNEIGVVLVDDLQGNGDLLQRGQEELLVEMGLNPYEPGTAFEEVLPGVVAGLWEIPLQPIESRIRRELGLDMVRIFVPVVRNTVEELVWTQTRQSRVSQSYLNYLQGSRVVLGKSVGRRTFASWTGQLMSTTAVESSDEVRLFQRWNLEYEVSRGLTLTGELVFDPQRDLGVMRGDPRLILRYRLDY